MISTFLAYYLYILGTFCVYKLSFAMPEVAKTLNPRNTIEHSVYVVLCGMWPILAAWAIVSSIIGMARTSIQRPEE